MKKSPKSEKSSQHKSSSKKSFEKGKSFSGNKSYSRDTPSSEDKSSKPYFSKERFSKTSRNTKKYENQHSDSKENEKRTDSENKPYHQTKGRFTNPKRNFKKDNEREGAASKEGGKPSAFGKSTTRPNSFAKERFSNPKRGVKKYNSRENSSQDTYKKGNAYENRSNHSSAEDTPKNTEGYKPRENTRGSESYGDKRKSYGDSNADRFSKKPSQRNRPEGYKDTPKSERFVKKTFSKDKNNYSNSPEYKGLKERLPQNVRNKIKVRESLRLNQFIAKAGVCSRREADDLIKDGYIKVNDQVINEMGYQVKKTDKVFYKNTRLHIEKMVYVLLNKSKNHVSTTSDPEERKTVLDLVKDAATERIYPVGRLDRNTTGLILLTNDGDLAQKLAHPSNKVPKIYQVELDKSIAQEDFEKLFEEIELKDGPVKIDKIEVLSPDNKMLGIEIHSGRNRIIRRIFEHLGYEVVKLDRTAYAGLDKKNIGRGEWRYLTEKEVIRIKYFI